MKPAIRIEQFTDKNISDYELLTKLGDDGKLCYCSFWHAKWSSMDEYDKLKAEKPERLKECVIERMRSQFHVGVIAYFEEKPCAWISVGPLIDFYWAWKRVAQVGEIAKSTAGIMCFTIAPEFRGKKLQAEILRALTVYAKDKGWTAIEAYPFSDLAIEKHGPSLKWPGLVAGYEKAGFKKLQDHWLSSPDAQRFIYKLDMF
jgi:GNAT superfamily N-acetyltransferase